MKRSIFSLIASLALVWGGMASAIQVLNYTAATNLRFDNDPSFVGSGYDWSGVGRTANGRWATLIGDNYFVTANHFGPTVGQGVTFVAGNSVGSTAYTYTVAGRFQVAGTDLVIAYFVESVDSSIARYAFNTTPANSLAEVGIAGQTLFTSGDRVAGADGTVYDHVVGQNQAESWFEQGSTTVATPQDSVTISPAASFDQLVTFRNLVGDNANTVTTYESQLQAGDSGSPLFSTSGSDLILQGIGWAVSSSPLRGNFVVTGGFYPFVDSPETRDATFFSYLGSYTSGINNAISLVPTPIPEPSGTWLFFVSGCLVWVRRRAR